MMGSPSFIAIALVLDKWLDEYILDGELVAIEDRVNIKITPIKTLNRNERHNGVNHESDIIIFLFNRV